MHASGKKGGRTEADEEMAIDGRECSTQIEDCANKCDYFYIYSANVKQRWKNRPIIDVLSQEFTSRGRDYYLKAIEAEVITVNNKAIPPAYKLKDQDIIRHIIHAHEPPQPEIEILAEEKDFIVVNKPSGIPCHPVGSYHYYSVTATLFPNNRVGCVNRLDMPVSGVLIIAVNNRLRIHELLETATKVYVAKVKGQFPECVDVDQPIGEVETRILDISPSGKPSRTSFKRISYSGGYSLVQCMPITGRTHQIRIHMKYLGFPILNDILYGEADEILETPLFDCSAKIDDFYKLVPRSDEKSDFEKFDFVVKNCKGRQNRTFLIKDAFICLHAWKYIFDGREYEAPLPGWALNF